MKFAEHLAAHITPEWHKQYINYEEMKTMLYQAFEEAPATESVEEDVLKRHFANFDEQFFHYCDQELKKINTFYSEKLAEATRKFATLSAELKISLESSEKLAKKSKSLNKIGLPNRKKQEFKLAFSEFYLSLILLQNYQNLNHIGFRKILKKHDKLLRVDSGAKWRQEYVDTSHFFVNKDIDNIIHETETLVTTELDDGNRQRAMKRLRVPPLGEKQSPWTTFKVGLFSGSFIVLFVAVLLTANYHVMNSDDIKMALRLYRGPFLIIQFIFLIGINVYGWRSSGVNHVLIFELDPRNHLSEQHLMELAGIFGVVWTLSLLSFLYSNSLGIPLYVNPLLLTILMICFLINPLKIFRHDARFWLLRICWRMITAPLLHVGFADFWLADQFNSLVTALLDFEYLTCFYIMNQGNWLIAGDTGMCLERDFYFRPFVNCLPAWFRFAQCLRRYRDTKEAFPHLVNAGKYSTTFAVVIFSTLRNFYGSNYSSTYDNPFTWLWFLMAIISSTYAYIWDIKMDWGLFDKNATDNRFLRDEIVYSSNYYYFAIIEDFILRYIWMLSFYLQQLQIFGSETLTSITAPLEVIRRFIWNFFRLENEHLNNCGKFRAVRDISIAPIDSSDQLLILRMMDEDNGVLNRYTKSNRPKPKKSKDPEKKHLLGGQKGGNGGGGGAGGGSGNFLMDLTIDGIGTKNL